jgi:hypothetical protein
VFTAIGTIRYLPEGRHEPRIGQRVRGNQRRPLLDSVGTRTTEGGLLLIYPPSGRSWLMGRAGPDGPPSSSLV